MKTVLLIVDLEGVGGVDSSRALSAASPAFAGARRLATDEVLAALGGLFGRGVERVRVSDSHRPGGSTTTIIAEELPPGAELIWTGDPYDAALFDGVDAVACLGMHAAAGTPGFASHTVSVQCAWQAGGRDISETDIVLALAAERGVPALFVTGDDV